MASYVYRPLAATKGETVRCAGIVSDSTLSNNPGAYVLADTQHSAGAFLSSEYLGPVVGRRDPRLARLFTEIELLSIDRCYALRKASGALFRDEVRRAANDELRGQQ